MLEFKHQFNYSSDGYSKFRELRAMVGEELGEKFDFREFHEVVLLKGSMPLRVLKINVMEWFSK